MSTTTSFYYKGVKIVGTGSQAGGLTAPTPSVAPVSLDQNPPAGVELPSSIDELIYFDGRILKAANLTLEQKGLLLRDALAERAQGAGVSYGFHVSASAQKLSKAYVDQISGAVVDRMKGEPEWANLLIPAQSPTAAAAKAAPDAKVSPDEAAPATPVDVANYNATVKSQLTDEVKKRLSIAVEEICGGDPGQADATFTISAGHAADGYGNDLYLAQDAQVKLADLLAAYTAHPTQCETPGPSITPVDVTGSPQLAGAFLLCIYRYHEDGDPQQVYGVQCNDNSQNSCSFGTRSEGVGAQLVAYSTLSLAASAAGYNWRGAGARAYFSDETDTADTLLPSMLASLPFSDRAAAPDLGTHVPIGMVYLAVDRFVAYDEWTAKRLRAPAEMTYWLRALVHPSKPSQLARVLQFESQLEDALHENSRAIASLWKLGFADSSSLTLPGVGFLPIKITTKDGTLDATQVQQIQDAVATFLDGVPYQLLPATQGELNAIFTGAIEAPELVLTRDAAAADEEATQANIQTYEYKIQAWDEVIKKVLAVDSSQATIGGFQTERSNLATALEKLRGGLKVDQAPQVLVWYPETGYRNYVMFTWPTAARAAATGNQVQLCIPVRLASAATNQSTERTYYYNAVAKNSETALIAEAGKFINATTVMRCRDNEMAGAPPFEIDGLRFYPAYIQQLAIYIEPAVRKLSISYRVHLADKSGFQEATDGTPLSDDGNGFIGFSVKLSGSAALDYDVRYMGRFVITSKNATGDGSSGFLVIETPYFQNGARCGYATVNETLNVQLIGFLVRVTPKGCAVKLEKLQIDQPGVVKSPLVPAAPPPPPPPPAAGTGTGGTPAAGAGTGGTPAAAATPGASASAGGTSAPAAAPPTNAPAAAPPANAPAATPPASAPAVSAPTGPAKPTAITSAAGTLAADVVAATKTPPPKK